MGHEELIVRYVRSLGTWDIERHIENIETLAGDVKEPWLLLLQQLARYCYGCQSHGRAGLATNKIDVKYI